MDRFAALISPAAGVHLETMARRRITMRPRFEILLPTVEDDCMRRLGKLLEEDESPYVGQVLKKHAFIQLPREERSLLSPYLNLNIINRDGKCYLDGRFTPKPEVWMGFMAIYGVLGMVGLSGLMYGFAQMTVKETPLTAFTSPKDLYRFRTTIMAAAPSVTGKTVRVSCWKYTPFPGFRRWLPR